VKHWNADELAVFSHWLTHCYRGDHQEILFIFLAMATGARRGELVALTRNDIGYGYININKTAYRACSGQLTKEPKSKHGCRIVTVSPKITDKIDDMMFRRGSVNGVISPYVFTQSDNIHQMAVDAPSHFFNKIVKEAPVPFITLHGLRHTHASILITEGVDIATVSKRLGHSKTSVTLDIYTHSSPTEDNNASSTISRILGI
jgi:integrase